MTQAKLKFASFEAYLSYSNDYMDNTRLELINGELVELPPESELNNWIVQHLFLLLTSIKLLNPRLIKTHMCEIQVPVLQPRDSANRYPDLVVLREEHIPLTQRRLTITLDMPPPRLIVEVVSPGKTSRDRDYIRKRAQYAAIDIPEYWLIDPVAQMVLVLTLTVDGYQEVGVFTGEMAIVSPELEALQLTAQQIFDTKRRCCMKRGCGWQRHGKF